MKGYKHLSKTEKKMILEVYKETKSASVTAERLGLGHQKVAGFLKRSGHKLNYTRNSACLRNKTLVLEMVATECSLTSIGKAVGTTHHRVKDFLVRHGIDYCGQTQRHGDKNSHWKGGRKTDEGGYVWIYSPGHPNAVHGRYVLEHRLEMEKKIGRHLERNEVVHHIDGNRQNNHIDNLEMFQNNGAHLAVTLKGKVPNWTPLGYKNMCKPRCHGLNQKDT